MSRKQPGQRAAFLGVCGGSGRGVRRSGVLRPQGIALEPSKDWASPGHWWKSGGARWRNSSLGKEVGYPLCWPPSFQPSESAEVRKKDQWPDSLGREAQESKLGQISLLKIMSVANKQTNKKQVKGWGWGRRGQVNPSALTGAECKWVVQ